MPSAAEAEPSEPRPEVSGSVPAVPARPPRLRPPGCGREARLEGHVLADGDLGLFVVGGEDVRRGDDVHVGARFCSAFITTPKLGNR